MFLVRTYIDKSEIHGVGVFAAEDIAIDSLVWEFHPVVDRLISTTEFEELPDPTKEMIRRHAEFLVTQNAFILSGDNDRFMNHSETPNIRDDGLRMYSQRHISANEELTCDYRHVRILDFTPTSQSK